MDGSVRIWHCDDQNNWTSIILEKKSNWIKSVDINNTGLICIVGSYDKNIKTWFMAGSWKNQELIGHSDWIQCVGINNDGSRIAIIGPFILDQSDRSKMLFGSWKA